MEKQIYQMVGNGSSFVGFHINIEIRQLENNSIIPTVFMFVAIYVIVTFHHQKFQYKNMIEQMKHSGYIIRLVKAWIGWLRSLEGCNEIKRTTPTKYPHGDAKTPRKNEDVKTALTRRIC
jgi:hypothetical protein